MEFRSSQWLHERKVKPLGWRLLQERMRRLQRPAPASRVVIHRGFAIRFHRTLVGWIGHVRRPDSLVFTNDGLVTATLEEGEAVLIARACARIDAGL